MKVLKEALIFFVRLIICLGLLFLVVHYIKNVFLALGWFFILCAVFVVSAIEWGMIKNVYQTIRGQIPDEHGVRDPKTGKVQWASIIFLFFGLIPLSILFWGPAFVLGGLIIYFYK